MNEEELIEVIRQRAAQAIVDFSDISDVKLGFDRESVAWFDSYIERMRNRTDFNDGTWRGLFHTIGAFLGESILRKAGGSWRWSEKRQCWVIVLLTGDWSSPMTKVENQFKNGPEDSILSFYDIAVDFVARGGLHDQAPPSAVSD